MTSSLQYLLRVSTDRTTVARKWNGITAGLVVAPGGGNRHRRCSGNQSEAEALIPVLFHLFLSVSQHSAHFGNCAADVTAGGGGFIVS